MTTTVNRGFFSDLVESTAAVIDTGWLDLQGTYGTPCKTINIRVTSTDVAETFTVSFANQEDGAESLEWTDVPLDAAGNGDFVLSTNSRRYMKVASADASGDKTINYACGRL